MTEEVDDDKADLRDRFFKERRLLLGISVVLLAHQWLGITIDKDADTLGLKFEIDDPSKIWWAVWAIWTWTMVCCLQQLNSLRPSTIFPADRAQEVAEDIADKLVTFLVRRDAMKHLREHIPRRGRSLKVEYAGRHKSVEGQAQQTYLYTCIRVSARWRCNEPNEAAARAADLDKDMEIRKWHSNGGGMGYEDSHCRFDKIYNVRVIPIRERPWVRRVSFVWTCLTTSFGTDYVVPLLIGAAPVIVLLYSQAKAMWLRW